MVLVGYKCSQRLAHCSRLRPSMQYATRTTYQLYVRAILLSLSSDLVLEDRPWPQDQFLWPWPSTRDLWPSPWRYRAWPSTRDLWPLPWLRRSWACSWPWKLHWQFMEHDAMQVRHMPSCCVCLSVIFVNSVKTSNHIFKTFSSF